MNEEPARTISTFATTARQQVRLALELAIKKSPDTATRIEAALTSMSSDAVALGLSSIGDLARRGCDQALRIDNDPAARTALARTLRELGRAVEVLDQKPRVRGKVLIVDDSALNAAVV